MIDIHTHCLPDIDDGAKDLEESKSMLKDCFLQGIDLVVATPHCVVHSEEDINSFLKKRNEAFLKLQNELAKNRGGYPEIMLGGEIYLDNDISEYANFKNLCIDKTEYMLLEIPPLFSIKLLTEWIYNLIIKGVKPVLAHIDRYENWEEICRELGGMEVMYQINSARFLSFRGRKFIKNFLKENSKIIISSDMHNMNSRKNTMEKAYKIAVKKYGKKAYELFKTLTNEKK